MVHILPGVESFGDLPPISAARSATPLGQGESNLHAANFFF